MLEAIAKISDTPSETAGVTRLAYTATEREAHALVGGWLSELGLAVRVDAVGNTIAELPGRVAGSAAIGTGSHLDSVPLGGAFDGIAGVVAAVECARLLVTGEVALDRPLRVCLFAAEEGARFGQACLGSKAVAGLLSDSAPTTLRDRDGVTLAEAMRGVGFDPGRLTEARWSRTDWAGFVELHIEQGAVLQEQGLPVGVVDLISGSTRLSCELLGRATHSGSTPMHLRADALAAAAEVVLLAEALATDARHRGTRATVGVLVAEPGSLTTIPGRVELTLDVRDVDSDRQRAAAAEIMRGAVEVCERRGVRFSARPIGDSSPVVLPIWMRQVVIEACARRGLRYRVLTSGASHDAQMVNRVAPTALIFVPSQDGLSHVRQEWTSSADLAVGTDLLVESVIGLDRRLTELDTGEV
jgi:allantoate deiminase